jgi:hypothetical protein
MTLNERLSGIEKLLDIEFSSKIEKKGGLSILREIAEIGRRLGVIFDRIEKLASLFEEIAKILSCSKDNLTTNLLAQVILLDNIFKEISVEPNKAGDEISVSGKTLIILGLIQSIKAKLANKICAARAANGITVSEKYKQELLQIPLDELVEKV